MTAFRRVRAQRVLREAEGYLELAMPRHALSTLDRLTDPGTFEAHKLWLQGEALRALEQYAAATGPLERAADLAPSNTAIYLALGWCYKRSGRLVDAIGVLTRAREADPSQAILHYNLACYHSLAGQKAAALEALAEALKIEPQYREQIVDESDFDSLRHDPEFQTLTGLSFSG